MDAAKLRVRARVAERHRLSIGGATRVPPALPLGPTQLLRDFAAILDVAPEHLRLTDTLGELVRVSRSELPAISGETWRIAGLGDVVEPFAYEIMYFAERTPKRAWRRYWEQLVPRPRNEEEWIDHFMMCRLDQFLALVSGAATVHDL